MKKINFKLNLSILALATLTTISAYSQNCPIAPTQVTPAVQSKVVYNKKSKLYTYSYTISNSRGSSLNIADVALVLKSKPLNILGPQKWLPDFVTYQNGVSAVYWSTVNKTASIKVGGSLKGFSFQSPNPPGVAKLLVEGDAEVPTSVPTATDDEPEPDCPGFFNDREPLDDRVTLLTEGPEEPSQISAKIKIIYKDFKGEGSCHIKPEETGKVKVLLMGSDKLDVSKIDLTSIRFGREQAPILNSKIVDEDDKRKKIKNLLLEFDLEQVGITCNIDHALFLTGKLVGAEKEIIGGAPLDASICKKGPYHGSRNHKHHDHHSKKKHRH